MSRSRSERDEGPSVPHPRANAALFGHQAAEQTLLEAYRSGRVPHAWLISGPAGIGKATLAYRFARFVLAHPDAAAPAVQQATSLAIADDHPVARRTAVQAQGDLLALERRINEKTGKLFQDIPVDDIRRTVQAFGATAGEGGWRVAVIDSLGDLNVAGANALLKLVEEPPRRSLLLLVAHSAARVLPTIRSRCRVLALRPLETEAVVRAAAAALGRDPTDPELAAAAAAADGCVARAIALCGGPLLALRQQVTALLGQMPNPDPRGLHALGDAMGNPDRSVVDGLVETFVETVREWLTAELHRNPGDLRRAAALAEAWRRIEEGTREVLSLNLEVRPLVFAVFGWLAEAARG